MFNTTVSTYNKIPVVVLVVYYFFRNNDLVSSGEDGVVNILDLRTYKVSNKIEPFKNDKVNRPDLGKWIGAASTNDDYVVSNLIILFIYYVEKW